MVPGMTMVQVVELAVLRGTMCIYLLSRNVHAHNRRKSASAQNAIACTLCSSSLHEGNRGRFGAEAPEVKVVQVVESVESGVRVRNFRKHYSCNLESAQNGTECK
jgi:hypothetical protein